MYHSPFPIWQLETGDGPLVATALHEGARLRADVRRHLVLDEGACRREEDPFTGGWTRIAPTRIIGSHSRFQVDLNRPREKAVYRTAEDCWGLSVWDGRLPEDVVARSLGEYDAFYEMLHGVYASLAERHGRFVVYDLHTYNHRRDGPGASVAEPQRNPQVNLGTRTMRDRARWAGVIERFQGDLGDYGFPGGRLDVRENVRFFGGQHPRWAHETFPDSACVLAIEVKKFFMDEWTGEADLALVGSIERALGSTVPGVLAELAKL